MARPKRYTSSSTERRVQSILKPRIYMMFVAEQTVLLRGESEHGADIITKHYESLTASHQAHLLNLYEKQKKK